MIDDLFSGAYARTVDPDTSHHAADMLDVDRCELMVLGAFKGRRGYGLTTHEIEAITGMEAGTVTPRMKPLELKGRVRRTDMRRVPHGYRRPQIVWVLV